MSREREIVTIEGPQTATDDDFAYMEYLDELWQSDYSFGLLLFKGDPIAFRLGRDEWLSERAGRPVSCASNREG